MTCPTRAGHEAARRCHADATAVKRSATIMSRRCLVCFDVLTPDRARSSGCGLSAPARRRERTRRVDLHGGRGAKCKRGEHAGIIDTDVDRPGWQQAAAERHGETIRDLTSFRADLQVGRRLQRDGHAIERDLDLEW
jgi:hypothetical protein